MAVSDPLADFLTRIRNAIRAQHHYVDVSWSKMKQRLADILKAEGFIEDYLVKVDESYRGTIRLILRYTAQRRPVIHDLKRVSSPGRRIYVPYDQLIDFYGNAGVSIVSTSQGVMTGAQARKKKIGGELLCRIW